MDHRNRAASTLALQAPSGNKPSQTPPHNRHQKDQSPKSAASSLPAQQAPCATQPPPADSAPEEHPTTHPSHSSHNRSRQSPASLPVQRPETPTETKHHCRLSETPLAQPSSHHQQSLQSQAPESDKSPHPPSRCTTKRFLP